MYCPHCMHHFLQDVTSSKFCSFCGGSFEATNEIYQLPIGTIIGGRYYIGKSIGQGGFGITYVGCDTRLDMKIAIKEYYPQGIVGRVNTYESRVTVTAADKAPLYERERQKFIQEARILAGFEHNPNVVSVRDVFAENNTAYIIMEYIQGITLEMYHKQHGNFSFDEAVRMLDPVMEALGEVHARGLIHRDISPENIMITDQKRTLKLLDFGAARGYTEGSEKSMTIILKPGYAPPEQYSRHGKQGPWSDVYALSATIYYLITGVTPENAFERINNDQVLYPSAVGAEITPEEEAVLMCGMAVDVQTRIPSVSILRAALNDAKNAVRNPNIRSFYRPNTTGTSDEVNTTGMSDRVNTSGAPDGLIRRENLYKNPVSDETVPLYGFVNDKKPKSATERAADKTEANFVDPAAQRTASASPEGKKRGGKKLFFGLGLLAVIAVCAVFIFLKSGNEDPVKMGEKYYYGKRVEQSYEKAVEYFQKAADQGNSEGQWWLGKMYESGKGVGQSYEKAAELYQKAADQGMKEAQYLLGSLYENGFGVEQSYEKAAEYYQKAADQGIDDAKVRLKIVNKQLK